MFKQYKPLIILFSGVWLVSFLLAFWAGSSGSWQGEKKPLPSLGNALFTGGQAKVPELEEQVYYTRCRHLLTRDLDIDDPRRQKTSSELSKEGWAYYHSDSSQAIIFKNLDAICPDCADQRHLGTAGDFVAVYQGPVGVPGDQVKVLSIQVSRLPLEWQDKVRRGELNFSSEQELLEALDSIDEYQ